MGSPQVNNSAGLVKVFVLTTELEVEVEPTEHEYAESTQLIDNERQIKRIDASNSDVQSVTDHSVSINSTSLSQNENQQNCESVIPADECATKKRTAENLNNGSLNNTSNTIDNTKAIQNRQRLVKYSCHWESVCGCLLNRKPLRIQALMLVVVLLAALVTGALVPTAVYGMMLANERNEVELISKRLCGVLAEVDEISVEMMRLQQWVKIGSTSNSSVAPNYTSIDRVIDDPPNDDAARSLFYELAPFQKEQCCANDPTFWRRLAVAQHMLGFVQGENNSFVLLDYMKRANDSAYFAISLGANDSDSYSWTGIIDGILGQKSIDKRVQLATSFRFKHWIDKALELQPDDPRALTARGGYHFELTRVSNVERTLASMVLGPIPEGSVDKALDDLQRAERTFRSHGRVWRQTWLLLALSLQQKAQPERARAIAQEAAAQPVRTVFDRLYQGKLEALLTTL